MKTFVAICASIEFCFKVAAASTLVQQAFYFFIGDRQLGFGTKLLLYWLSGSLTYYAVGFFIEGVLKKNERLRARLNVRQVQVKPQPYPRFTARGLVMGELRALGLSACMLYLMPQAHRGGQGLLANFAWFVFLMVCSECTFYCTHWFFHRKSLYFIHRQHHEFRDTSAWVGGNKSTLENIIVTVTEALPSIIFGYDVSQLCAWNVIGTAWGMEGHSGAAVFFISSDYHDLHHTAFKRNYGILELWDHVFGTMNSPTRQRGLRFPLSTLAALIADRVGHAK